MSFIVPAPDEGEQFGALIDELLERGYLTLGPSATGRAARFVNDGLQRVIGAQLWPFRLAQANGPAPLDISDLGVIAAVRVNGLNYGHMHRLEGRNPDDTGVPLLWRFRDSVTVTTWPVDTTAELSVDYYRRHTRHVAREEPVMVPSGWSEVVLDAAQLHAAKDARDWDNVAGLRAEVTDGLARMADELLDAQVAENEVLVPWGED